MQKTILSLLLLLIFTACLNIEEKNNGSSTNLSPVDYENVPIRWSNTRVSTSNLNLLISAEFDENEQADIKEIIEKWNNSHDDLTFMNENPETTPHINTNDLNTYRDNILGVYKSYSWFNELSTFALGVTQFYATRRNAGTPDEFLEILHADIIINFRDYNFDSKAYGYSGYDLYSVILHEMGHFIGLKHSDHVDDIMSPYLDTGELKHTLSHNDITIVNDLYTAINTNALLRKSVRDMPEEDYEDIEIIKGIIEIFPSGVSKKRFQVIRK